MRRILPILLLLAFLAPIFAATVTVDCRQGGPLPWNKVTQAPSIVTENQITVQITPGSPVVLMMVCDQAWTYRSTTGTATTNMPVAAGQTLTLRFTESTNFFYLRQTADGTLALVPLQQASPAP